MHEALRAEIQRHRAAALLLPGIALALKQEAPADRRHQLLRVAEMVREVGFVVAGQRDDRAVVEVVVPERVQPVAAAIRRTHQLRLLRLVLGDQERRALAARLAHAPRDRRHQMFGRGVVDLLGRVQAQAVEVEFVDPVGGVLDEQLARRAGVVAVEVQRRAPLVRVAIGEVVGREAREIVPVGADVVVDHVEDHAQAQPVRGVDEAAQIVGAAVEPRRRPQVDAVVAPAEAAGEFRERHELDQRDAEVAQIRQPLRRRRVGPGLGEGADVQLVDHLAARAAAAPLAVAPGERARIDHLRRPVRPLGLKARRRIGVDLAVVVELEAVAIARAQAAHQAREVAAGFGRQRRRRRQLRAMTDDDAPAARRPDAQVRAAGRRVGLGADRIAARRRRAFAALAGCARVMSSPAPARGRSPTPGAPAARWSRRRRRARRWSRPCDSSSCRRRPRRAR